MPSKYSSGKYAIAECDRCGQRYKLSELKKEVIKTKLYQIKVCPTCWDPDHPQLQLGMYPVNDPQSVREPRPDISYTASGLDVLGNISGGSRVYQWGWYPVGGSSSYDSPLTLNYLVGTTQVGNVTISTT
jgi:hypothetical protein